MVTSFLYMFYDQKANPVKRQQRPWPLRGSSQGGEGKCRWQQGVAHPGCQGGRIGRELKEEHRCLGRRGLSPQSRVLGREEESCSGYAGHWRTCGSGPGVRKLLPLLLMGVKCSRCPTTGLARGSWDTGQYQALPLGWCKKGRKSQVRPWDGHPGSQVLGKTETPGEKVRLAPWMGWSQAGLASCSVLLGFHTEFLGA